MLLALLSVAFAEPYALNDAGLTLTLPSGLEASKYSDWDLQASSRDGYALDVWYTAWQIPVTEKEAAALLPVYEQRLKAQHASGVTITKTAIATVGGHEVGRNDLRFDLGGGTVGVGYAAAFPLDGKVMHVMTFAASPNAAKAERALTQVLEKMTIQKAPSDLAKVSGTLATDLGFSIPLPDGWRGALPAEMPEVTLQLNGIGPKDTSKCKVATHPYTGGTADLLLFCKEDWIQGILDDLSFTDQASLIKQKVFGKAADKIPDAKPIKAADRVGVLLSPEIPDHDLRLGAMPYDGGTAVAWGLSPAGHGAALEAALVSSLSGLKYAGPDNGLVKADMGATIVHTLTYDPFNPGVLCCGGATLAMLGGIGAMMMRKPKPKTEFEA
jgi:hypothetical protein